MSPISSRNKVPLSANWNRPLRSDIAPVKEPLLCPNNSLSSKSLGIAPQLTGTNGPAARPEHSCSAFATSSFPVPLSPTIKTVESLGPSSLISSRRALIDGLSPIILFSPSTFSCILSTYRYLTRLPYTLLCQ